MVYAEGFMAFVGWQRASAEEKVGIREPKDEIAQSVGGTREGEFHTDAVCAEEMTSPAR
jgi:hypothetical protein